MGLRVDQGDRVFQGSDQELIPLVKLHVLVVSGTSVLFMDQVSLRKLLSDVLLITVVAKVVSLSAILLNDGGDIIIFLLALYHLVGT